MPVPTENPGVVTTDSQSPPIYFYVSHGDPKTYRVKVIEGGPIVANTHDPDGKVTFSSAEVKLNSAIDIEGDLLSIRLGDNASGEARAEFNRIPDTA